ncbi:MAG TPA: TonB family protein [Candidatus Acidoferrum sp.]|nr:TonB family protein [Candidatus Acidoferrum sp.]
MSTTANSIIPLPPISADDLGLRKFLVYSLILHVFLVLWIAVSIYFHLAGPEWGDVGGTSGSINVKIVGPASGIPMPPQPIVTDSKTVDPTKGLWKEEPKPKPPEPPTPAEKVPVFKNEKPKPITHKSKVDEPKVPPPDNAVDYGKHGSPDLPTGYAPTPGGGSGPVSVKGQGGGDFASRYGWYIEAVRRSVGQNWLQTTIDPPVRAARQAHCVMTFRINRDGTVSNVQMSQSSGNLSMDNSARRALDGIHFGPLPNEYSGNSVDVIFDFDLSLSH